MHPVKVRNGFVKKGEKISPLSKDIEFIGIYSAQRLMYAEVFTIYCIYHFVGWALFLILTKNN